MRNSVIYNYLEKLKSRNFQQNLHVFVKMFAKNTIFILFVFSSLPYLVNGLSSNKYFFLITLDDPIRSFAANAEAPVFRRNGGNEVEMISQNLYQICVFGIIKILNKIIPLKKKNIEKGRFWLDKELQRPLKEKLTETLSFNSIC